MIKQGVPAAVIAAFVLALVGCAPKPVNKAGPNYQATMSAIPPPANVAAICYDDATISAYRVRMVQQEMAVGTLSCKGADGSRTFDKQYLAFLAKFNNDLSSNAGDLKAGLSSKKANVDVVVTEISNRTAQQPNGDKEFCSRYQRAFDWALSPQVTSLSQVVPPYDFGPDMNIFPCPKG